MAITPTTMKTSDLIGLAIDPSTLINSLSTITDGSCTLPDPAVVESIRAAILAEIDRRIPIPA